MINRARRVLLTWILTLIAIVIFFCINWMITLALVLLVIAGLIYAPVRDYDRRQPIERQSPPNVNR